MNRFADYFSNYVNDDTITYIGNGDITSFTVSRQDRELAVGLNFGKALLITALLKILKTKLQGQWN